MLRFRSHQLTSKSAPLRLRSYLKALKTITKYQLSSFSNLAPTIYTYTADLNVLCETDFFIICWYYRKAHLVKMNKPGFQ